VSCKRGEHFRVGDMLEVGVVLADERGPEGWKHKNARGEVDIFEDGEAIAECERVRIEALEKVGFSILSVFPVGHRSGQIGVKGVN
jgi:hypothetical protein